MTWLNHCHLPVLNRSKEKFLSTHETFDHAHSPCFFTPMRRRFLKHFSRTSGSFFLAQPGNPTIKKKERPNFTPVKEHGYDERFVELELYLEADVVLPYAFQSGQCCCGDVDPCADFRVEGAVS